MKISGFDYSSILNTQYCQVYNSGGTEKKRSHRYTKQLADSTGTASKGEVGVLAGGVMSPVLRNLLVEIGRERCKVV